MCVCFVLVVIVLFSVFCNVMICVFVSVVCDVMNGNFGVDVVVLMIWMFVSRLGSVLCIYVNVM